MEFHDPAEPYDNIILLFRSIQLKTKSEKTRQKKSESEKVYRFWSNIATLAQPVV